MRLSDPTINPIAPPQCYIVGAVAAIVGTVVSVGMSIYGASQQASSQRAAAAAQEQQAENARAVAQYNANISRQNNQVQYQMAQYQASYAANMAQMNQSMMVANAAMAEQQGAYSTRAYEQNLENAKQKELDAATTRAQSREAADRERAKNEQQIALIRSKIGASGVTFEGTPLETLSESARLGEATVQDLAYAGDLASRKQLKEAKNLEFDAYGNLLEAKGHDVEAMNFRNQASMYGYDASLGEFDSEIAGAQYRIGNNYAKLIELGGEEKAYSYNFAAQQSRYGATASLISGYGNAASSAIKGVSSVADLSNKYNPKT